MNILFLINRYPNFGGTEKVTSVLANYFAEKGHGVSLFSMDQPHPEANELSDKVKFYAYAQPVYSKENISALHNALVEDNIDILVNQFCLPYYSNQLCQKAMVETKAKLISVLHGVPDKCNLLIENEGKIQCSSNFLKKIILRAKSAILEQVVKWSERYVYKHSDAYVVLSEGFVKSFKEYSRIKESSKLLSIGNPISIPTSYDKSVIAAKKKQILYVGRMARANKRVDRILATWKVLYKNYPDWNLCLVGGGPDLEALKLMAAKLKLERVVFTGFIEEEPLEYYKDSSILMLTSDLEGFGLVILEGMSYGVIPVVFGSYVSIYDIVESGKNGYITPEPFSIEYTASYLKELMDHEEKRQQISIAAIDRAKDFSVEGVYRQWLQLFNRVLN